MVSFSEFAKVQDEQVTTEIGPFKISYNALGEGLITGSLNGNGHKVDTETQEDGEQSDVIDA